jgi:hypothetical protein
LKSTLQDQLKHQEKQMNTFMEDYVHLWNHQPLMSNFQDQRRKICHMVLRKLHLIVMVAWEW